MSYPTPERFFSHGATASLGTAFAAFVPPHPGSGGGKLVQKVVGGRPNWYSGLTTHLESVVYIAAGTAHDVVIMRPLNWAEVNGDVAHNATVVTLKTDPGVYTTNYKFPLPPEAGGKPASVANNAIAANDYVLVQLRDGNWHMSTVASVSGLAVTLNTATPNVAGGGIEDGSILYFFGVAADSVPLTGRPHLTIPSTASARTDVVGAKHGISIPGLVPGTPFIVYSANATAAGSLASMAGRYDKN